MNRLSLFLAVFFLAFFAACSDDKGPCDDGPSKGCLAGKWMLVGVVDDSNSKVSDETGSLELTSEGYYDFVGGVWSTILSGKIESIDGTTITIYCNSTGETLSGTITLEGSGAFSVRSNTRKGLFSQFDSNTRYVPNPIEKFERR